MDIRPLLYPAYLRNTGIQMKATQPKPCTPLYGFLYSRHRLSAECIMWRSNAWRVNPRDPNQEIGGRKRDTWRKSISLLSSTKSLAPSHLHKQLDPCSQNEMNNPVHKYRTSASDLKARLSTNSNQSSRIIAKESTNHKPQNISRDKPIDWDSVTISSGTSPETTDDLARTCKKMVSSSERLEPDP